MKTTKEELKQSNIEDSKQGLIAISTIEGIKRININEFIDQPIESILYDLNRDEATILTFIDDPKWVNDYAVCKVIRALKLKYDELKEKSKKTTCGNCGKMLN